VERVHDTGLVIFNDITGRWSRWQGRTPCSRAATRRSARRCA